MELRKRPGAGPSPSTEKKASIFDYHPLHPRKREIRLLELAPGQPGTPIFAKLCIASLDDNPAYEALSYTWGAPQPTHEVTIDGKPFPVGNNLRTALDDLRLIDRIRVIWTDAICINQPDDHEKSHQIKLMKTIYSSAQTVCAWINHNVRPKAPVFESLSRLGQGVEIDDFADSSYWYPVASIFRDPYWTRLWIQQELILAPKIKIYCGPDAFEGENLLEFQRRINRVKFETIGADRPEFTISLYVDGIDARKGALIQPQILYGGILHAQKSLRDGRAEFGEIPGQVFDLKINSHELGSSLLTLFHRSQGLNMTDPKDKVYGVLGIAADVDETKFHVDYNLPVANVYAKVFQHFISKYRSLSFLSFDKEHFGDRIPREEELPSWMPHATVDWGHIHASRACGTTIADRASINPQSLILTAEGVHIDTVAFGGPRMGAQREPPALWWLVQVEEMCMRLWPNARDSPLYNREHVTALFFPWLSEARYAATNTKGLQKPDAQQRAKLLLDVVAASQLVDKPDELSMDQIIWGGFHPPNVISSATREALSPLGPDIRTNVLFGTEGGYMGKTPNSARFVPGDEIWVIFGCRMPLILRPKPGSPGRFTLLGPAIIPPVMQGEALVGCDGIPKKAEVIEIE